MSDKALADAIEALARSQLLTVDVLRATQSTTQVMAERLGQICDQNGEILAQLEAFGGRQNESERAIKVVQSELNHVRQRVAALETARTPPAQSASR